MGHIQIHREFESRAEGLKRTLRIYTPDALAHEPDRRFPVLYMHDGQNIFSHPESAIYDTWCANQVLEKLIDEGAIEPWIIVGVDHTGVGRMGDYTPWDDKARESKGRGEKYAKFLTDELKPWVDRTFPTRIDARSTAVAGSSLGGLISLYLGLTRPTVFGRIGAFSPSVMWAEGKIFEEWKAHPQKWTRLYLDAGLAEYLDVSGPPMDYGGKVRDFFFHLKKLGYSDHELFFVLEPGGRHYEIDWHRRLPLALRWLLSA